MASIVAFYNLAFDADLQPVAAYGTTLDRGWLTGPGLLLCPDAVAGVDARQNRHRWRFQVAQPDEGIARAQAAGGCLAGEVGQDLGKRWAAVADLDSDTPELIEA